MNVDTLIEGDCLEVMQNIPDESIDLILCDLPYGTTVCKWDSIIPFEKLWENYKRIIKPRHAIVLFGAEPFSSHLRMSNPEMYKYDWIWVKNNAVGFVNAKLKPMPRHEFIHVFSDGNTSNATQEPMIYYPQGLRPNHGFHHDGNRLDTENTYARPGWFAEGKNPSAGRIQDFTNYPTTVLEFAKVIKTVHPTQKPVELCEYLIKTYTRQGEVVLDNCMGSGTTPVACIRTGRHFIGIEKTPKYFEIAKHRVIEAQGQKKLSCFI